MISALTSKEASIDGDMYYIESLLQGRCIMEFALGAQIQNGLDTQVLQFPEGKAIQAVYLCRTVELAPTYMLSGGGFVTSQVTEVLNAGHIHVAGSHFHTVFIVEHQHVIRAPGRIVGHNRHSRIGDIGHGNRIIFGYEFRIVGCIYFHLPLDERSRFPFKNTVSYIILFANHRNVRRHVCARRQNK